MQMVRKITYISKTPEVSAIKFGMPSDVHDVVTRAPILVKIGQRVLAWRGVEFWPFPLTCVVAFKTLSHYRASV